ncbi:MULTISPECIES: hypothetical protein [unclassified Nocardioides]|uniref:hypothetical protein n=1 Tax=unclassified Nocardioides TaxID=2615069 RepID=UPI0007027E5F|nr:MULTISPECIES: hypothetical protein [unclassified Nocardioides]KRC48751.1 hypothetical protein ASE19_17630 [Nocardioides sp. Root79]KRC75150.1 hypothetical protein ASE20_19530 [Nocardioides sp. Root240]
MRRCLGCASALLLSLTVAGCSLEREDDARGPVPSTSAATVDGEGSLRIEHAAEPQLFRAGDGLLLLAARTTDDGPRGPVLAATLDGDAWSAPEEISTPGTTTSPPRAAFNDAGAGVAVWTELTAGDDAMEAPVRTVARVRGTDGAWSDAQVLRGISYVNDVQVNAAGDVAVLGLSDEGAPILALGSAAGSWTTSDLDWYAETRIALDEHGGVHAIATSTERGGGGAVTTHYLPPGGVWTAPEAVDAEGVSTEGSQIVALPGGGEAIVIGTVSPNWQSTFDTQFYWTTAYEVRQRASRDEPFAEVWAKDGATQLQTRVVGGAVEVAWLGLADSKQVAGAEGPVTAPTTEVLTTARLGGDEQVLAQTEVEQENDDSRGGIALAPGSGCGARSWVWRPFAVDGVPAALAVRAGDLEATYPVVGAPLAPGLSGALACAGGDRPWVARVDDAVRAGSEETDDVRVTDATVVVAALR